MATIGITIPESVWSARSERFYTQVLHGLEDTAVSRGHTVLSHVAASRTEELEVMRRWAERGMVDLVILKDLLDEDDLPDQVRRLGLPFVVIGDVHQGEFSSVTVDNAGTMRRLLEDLHGCGHRAIGHVGGPTHLLHSRLRREAHQAFVREAGLPMLCAEGDYSSDSGAAATSALLAGPQRPTVLVFDNDAMAIAGAGQVIAGGLRVPEDVSIVAWDDSPACQAHTPPLAVLDHLPHQLGIDLARTGLSLLEDPGAAVRLAHEVPRLLPRGTLLEQPAPACLAPSQVPIR